MALLSFAFIPVAVVAGLTGFALRLGWNRIHSLIDRKDV